MKIKKVTFLALLSFLLVASCKKTPVTRVVEFNSTRYDTLGTFDNSGKPGNLLPKDTISRALILFLDSTLPEGKNLTIAHPELFSTSAIADVAIKQKSDVFITFVSQGTHFKNTFAFYTYPTNSPPASTDDIKVVTYVFPNAGQLTPLVRGDKVKLGSFEAGTSIGFILLKDAWNIDTHLINNKAVHFCSNDVLNPEINPSLKKHAVLINYSPENKVLIGFEDIDRTDPICDSDFNDLVLYCTVKS